MPARLLPNIESLVVAVLRANADIVALVGDRVGTELYAGAAAAIQVHLITSDEIVARHLDGTRVQVDGWGGSKLDAWTVAATARAVLVEYDGVVGSIGVMTGARTLAGPQWLPDSTFEPPRARYVTDLEVYAHPIPT